MSETDLRHRLEEYGSLCDDACRGRGACVGCPNDWARDALQRITDLEAQVSALTAQVESQRAVIASILVDDPVSPAPHQERE